MKALLHTAYGWTAFLKFGLFGVLFGFAVLNRYWLAPELHWQSCAADGVRSAHHFCSRSARPVTSWHVHVDARLDANASATGTTA
jgi:putative copper export protein